MKSAVRPRSNARSILRRRTMRLARPKMPPGGEAHEPFEYALLRKAGPTVVFENGLGATMLKAWSKVFPEIGRTQTVFAYNRAGYAASQPAATPRDGAHIVAELRALLRRLDLPPPYVLVGHSMGGLYMQLFARSHPDEVAGLVLIDPTHPRQFEGIGALERRPLWFRLLFGVFLQLTAAKDEFAAAMETGRQVLAAPAPQDLPVTVINAAPQSTDHEDAEILRFDLNKRIDFRNLFPGCRLKWVRSGHNIQSEHPEAVIKAIRDVIAQAEAQDA